eukprot:CAMPEP_0183318660 /NCGR_PEP_ID=MMETSP0160_2-20130417/61376_1 /TAXON_ID=2839 ORGANISM="Odontella Sinensis, Strain Grunow 1884" /NCGR_SAMPLE_ID=MMETSP0160_2 /ASSEMBLY_ACC=CAM_ASM_000250 /LENGTH=53 /DNA_ID=CAMNT_0025484985 /DNA_START=387 /DNA_END=548 /DNA_ORIENTATION=+
MIEARVILIPDEDALGNIFLRTRYNKAGEGGRGERMEVDETEECAVAPEDKAD